MDVEFVESSQIRDKRRKTKTKTSSFIGQNKSCKSCRLSVYKCSVLLKVGFSYYICKDFSELDTLLNTKYVHIKSTTVYAPRRNWDSPNPFLASECSPPPRNRGGGGLRVGGWGESQFRRLEKKLSTLPTLCC